MSSNENITNFFRNKVVFVTGATGFLGKALIEKILRSTEVQRIYVLARPKPGKTIEERFIQIFNDPAFVHVSSAFANCVVLHAEERYYTDSLRMTSKQLVDAKSCLGDDILDYLSPMITDKFPNTYCFTKSVTEEAIQNLDKQLPFCIFRPGIVYPTWEEPIPGWIDNMQGGIGATYCTGNGFLRVLKGSPSTRAAFVPIDFCVNMIMALAWHTALAERTSKQPPIYNLVPENANTIVWGTYWKYMKIHLSHAPLSTMIWHPFMFFIKNKYLFNFMAFVYQTVPAYILDGISWLMQKQPRMRKLNNKMFELADYLRYFITRDFSFETSNTRTIWESMTPEDRKIYNFDMASLQWNEYFAKVAAGLREHLNKEKSDTIPMAKKIWKRFYIIHCVLHGLGFGVILYLLWIFFI
ncbi:fatty acyl-CoA reductase wat-like isoform X2 [Haematobia irritans]|uniref:fatty acyl-CoA reductase wat-like isoform X2 n=1 Tax=Haematobia irritans TaxID=7368 RepID=UPI003F4F6E65